MKKAIIIPGLTEEIITEPYERIAGYFKESGFRPTIIRPNWSEKNTKKWVEAILNSIDGKHDEVTIFGFSMGAMIALLCSTRITLENLILCSPSGYFLEYAPLLTKDDMAWATSNITDFKDLSARVTLSDSSSANTFVLAGGKELEDWADFRQWISDIQAQTSWSLTTIKDTGHEIEAQEYQDAVSKLIKNLK